MKRALAFPLLLLIGAFTFDEASARLRNVTDPDAPRSLPEQGPVNVRWEDPARFSEIRYSHNSWESRRGNWVEELAEHLRKSAARRLPAGERLDVNITDIDLAGDYEPWRGVNFQDTRFLLDIYPPRMTLTFTRTDANGTVISQGERKLNDMAYLMSSAVVGRTSDTLRYEKNMINRWLSSEFPESGQTASR
ncbi:DUF3016 domain-containing protein [Lysobacter niabensis]|uniref:DUF3016 domain-containing protein n=1 Tax=Agrilutibacter niabensis TaxID=380628 RepID=UPI003613E927